MFAGMLGGMGLKLAALAVVLTVAAGAYWHYTVVKSERDAALAQVGALEVAHQVQQTTITALSQSIDDWKAQFTLFQATLDSLTTAQVEANKTARKLNDVLSKHDLHKLSLAKPKLIERRINSGTAGVLKLFKCSTGGCVSDSR
jgi:hypothetical protein